MSHRYAVLFFAASIAAAPLSSSSHAPLVKRTSTGHKVGTGFGVTIALIIFAAIVFYLGVQVGRAGTWFFWRAPPPPPPERANTPLPKPLLKGKNDLKSSIGFPKPSAKAVHEEFYGRETPSTLGGEKARPVELSPVEAKPRIIELSPIDVAQSRFTEQLPNETTLVEAGGGTPRRGRFERKSWFNSRRSRTADRQRSVPRDKEISIYEMPGSPSSSHGVEALPPLPPAYATSGQQKSEEADVDWSGIEFMRRMYADRKSLYKNGGNGKDAAPK